MISQYTIDAVKERAKISDVVQDFLPLKKIGSNWTRCCPFHEEKSPSFVIKESENFYKCFGCIHEDELIWTQNGLIKLKNVQIGQKVLDKYGKWQHIISIIPKLGNVIEVETGTFRKDPLKLTPDHTCLFVKGEDARKSLPYLYLSSKSQKTRYKGSYRKFNIKDIPITENEASVMKNGDFILFPIIEKRECLDLFKDFERVYSTWKKAKRITNLPVNEDTAFLYGLYLAEGSTNPRSIRWTFHIKEDFYGDEIQRILLQQFGLKSSRFPNAKKNTLEIICSKTDFTNQMIYWFGKGCSNKKIPAECLSWPINIQKKLIEGYKCGDGNKKGNSKSVSKELSYGLFAINVQCGLISGISYYPKYTSSKGQKHNEYWLLSNKSQQSIFGFYQKIGNINYFWSEIISIKSSYEKVNVIDITVENTHSFVTKLGMVHNCGKGSDVIGFLQDYKQWTYQQSIEYLANKYKIVMEQDSPVKTYIKPIFKNNTNLSDKLVKWFADVRKISQGTLLKMKISEGIEFMPHKSKELNTIQYNYFRNEELVNIKYRSGDKGMKLHKGSELIFYNLDSVIKAKEVYITEGENDTLSLIESGIMREGVGVISVPNGANIKSNNLTYLDSSIDLFDTVEKIYLATDNDVPGRKLREDLAERFGKEKCYYIEFKDKKDINDVLITYGIQGVIECCSDKKEFPLEGVFTISSFNDEIDDLYTNGLDMGVGVGIKEFDKQVNFSKGYVTIITGAPSHGKSGFLDQICLSLNLKHGWKFAFYSPENRPTKLHFSGMARKLIGKNWFGHNKMNEVEKNLVKTHLEGKIWWVKPEKDFTLKSILDSVLKLKKQKGVDAFCLDAWNKLEHKYGKSNETQYISEQLDLLGNFCEMNNIHCFLVAHPTKLLKDKKQPLNYEIPNLYSIAGSAAFFSKADIGMCVYRDYITSRTKVFIQKVRFSHWGELGYTEWEYNKESGRLDIIVGDNCIKDNSNWITKENRQSTIELSVENNNGVVDIIRDNGEESPF